MHVWGIIKGYWSVNKLFKGNEKGEIYENTCCGR